MLFFLLLFWLRFGEFPWVKCGFIEFVEFDKFSILLLLLLLLLLLFLFKFVLSVKLNSGILFTLLCDLIFKFFSLFLLFLSLLLLLIFKLLIKSSSVFNFCKKLGKIEFFLLLLLLTLLLLLIRLILLLLSSFFFLLFSLIFFLSFEVFLVTGWVWLHFCLVEFGLKFKLFKFLKSVLLTIELFLLFNRFLIWLELILLLLLIIILFFFFWLILILFFFCLLLFNLGLVIELLIMQAFW